MAKIPWKFNGYTWHINPETDSGFSRVKLYTEDVALHDVKSRIQVGGIQSRHRIVGGVLTGPFANYQMSLFEMWHEANTISDLIDHTGESHRCMVLRCDKDIVFNTLDFNCPRKTWKYTLEFVRLV